MILGPFVQEILRSLEPGDLVDRWAWRVMWLFLAGLLFYDIIFGG